MRSIVSWAVVAALAAVSILLAAPPDPLGADAPVSDFSAARALEHVRWIAKRPHPVRTAANKEVRDRLVVELERLGLEVELRQRASRQGWAVDNVVAKLAGTEQTGVIAITSHYDSVRQGPGAADDGAAVAAALETVRALRSGEPLRNDVWFVFTDGEEAGLLGAWALADDADFDDIDLVFNFEARGTRGRSLMFQTSPGNRELIEAYGAVVPRPSACSLMEEVYRRLPRDTDFTVFLHHEKQGLNFAFIGGYRNYHTPDDSIENLDLASMQHHGEAMLGLARAFGDRDLADLEHDESAVYFDLAGRAFVIYPASWAYGLTIGVVLLFVLSVVVGQRRGALRWAGLGWSALAVLRVVFYAAVIVGGLGYLALQLLGPFPGPVPGGPHDGWLYLGMTLIVLGVANAVIGSAVAKHGSSAVIVAALAFFALFLVATTVAVPGATFVFLWPLVLLLAAWTATLRMESETLASAVAILYAAPVVVLLAPLFDLLFQGLTLRSSLAHAPLLGLGLAALAPFLDRTGGGWTRPVVWLPTLLGLLAFSAGLL